MSIETVDPRIKNLKKLSQLTPILIDIMNIEIRNYITKKIRV